MKRLVTWGGVALSAILLYWILTTFDLAKAAEVISQAHVGWLIASAVVYGALFTLRGWRWAVLLRPVKAVSAVRCFEVFTIGFMANNILPARLGDVARAYVLARQAKLPTASSFSSVMLERIFDGVTVVLFLNIVLFVQPTSDVWINSVRTLSGAVFVGAIVVCGLIAWREQTVLALVRAVFSFAPEGLRTRVEGLVARLSAGLHSLRSPSQTATVIALSILIWTIETSVYVLAGYAFGLDIGFMGMVLVMAVLTLGLSVPSAPGFVGVFEGLIITAVGLYGITGDRAFAIALTVHLIHFIPGTLLGLIFAWRSGLQLTELSAAGESPAEPIAADAAIHPDVIAGSQ
ncbi:MAG: lysylphosphatidylglycerol synthase transmembrane domain-containing protein [Myxococcota bacterium]